MPDNGFEIGIGSVRDACAEFESLRADFDEVHQYVCEADPEPWMWGVTGLAFGIQYEIGATALRVLTVTLGPALEGIAVRIARACDDYEDVDGRAAKDIEGSANELPSGDWSDGVR